eukprot:403369963
MVLKRLPIENEQEPAFKIGYYIKVAENIDESLKVQIYDNKSGELYKDNDLIMKDSFLDFETITQQEFQKQNQQAQQQQAQEEAAKKQAEIALQQKLLEQTQQQAAKDSFMNIMNENKQKTREHVKQQNQIAFSQNDGAGGHHYQKPQYNSNQFQDRNANLNNPQFAGFRPKHEIHSGYVCIRCKIKGHHVKDCPTNFDPTYDPYQGKGVPKEQVWKRDLGISNQEFLDNKHKVFRDIVKESKIYEGQFEVQKFKQQQENPSDMFNQQNDGETIVTVVPDWQKQIPPSLVCQLCKDFIKRASLTKCCASSGCQKCIQQKLVERKFQCPFCSTVNVYAEDIIPNQQLRLVAEWFKRQMLIQDKIEEVEIKRNQNQDQDEMIYMITKINQTFQQNALQQQMMQQQFIQENYESDAYSQNEQDQVAEQQTLNQDQISTGQTDGQDKASQSAQNPLKFNPSIHSGTKYDPTLGRRVPVTDPNELPKIQGQAVAGTSMAELQMRQQQFMQIQMIQMQMAAMRNYQQYQGGYMPGQGMMQPGMMPSAGMNMQGMMMNQGYGQGQSQSERQHGNQNQRGVRRSRTRSI